MTSIAIALFEDAEELDWAGPWEVFAAWAQFWPDEVSVFTAAHTEGPIRRAKGLRVLADHTWSSAPDFDVLVYPGGQGTRPQLGDASLQTWIRETKERGVLMTSVCTGSLVYADAGLLDGRPATTHWGSLDLLGSLGKRSTCVPRSDSWTPERWSPPPACPRGSTWRCI